MALPLLCVFFCAAVSFSSFHFLLDLHRFSSATVRTGGDRIGREKKGTQNRRDEARFWIRYSALSIFIE